MNIKEAEVPNSASFIFILLSNSGLSVFLDTQSIR